VSDSFRWNHTLLQQTLLAAGYDIEYDGAWGHEAGGVMKARRERAGRAHLVVIDGAGRFGARVTVTTDEQARPGEIAGIGVRITDTVQHITMISGRLASCAELEAVLAGLDEAAAPGQSLASPSWTDLPPPP
jgi:hypothetical protein